MKTHREHTEIDKGVNRGRGECTLSRTHTNMVCVCMCTYITFVASSGGILQVLHSLDLDRVDWDWDWEWGTAIAVWQLKEKLPKRHK